MIPFRDEINEVKIQLINRYNPLKIILFGSCAKGCARKNSDIDLCVICDYEDKRKMLLDMMMNIDCERDVDYILYRPKEWEMHIKDTSTFAALIGREGVILHG